MKNKKRYFILVIVATVTMITGGMVIYSENKQSTIKLSLKSLLSSSPHLKKNAEAMPNKDTSFSVADSKQPQSFTLHITDDKQQSSTQENTDKIIHVDNLVKPKRENDNANIEVSRYLDIQLWNPNKFAKNVYDAYDEHNGLSAEHFIDFDETALQEIGVGDSFNLPLNKDSKLDVIVTDVEALQSNAINFDLMDLSGIQRGSLTQIGDRVEGFFIANDNQEYFLRAIGGVGWIASKESLIKNIESELLIEND